MNMTCLPLISVIIPTYNREKYIGEAIGSIAAQTYPNWEIIVVDDGSTDNTESIIRLLQEQAPIQYLQTKQPASGPSHARNLGIAAAQGEFLIFLDSDDLYYPDALMSLYQGFQKHPDKLVIQGFYTSVSEDLQPIRTQGLALVPLPHGRGYALPYGEVVDWMTFIKGQVCVSLTTGLFRREVFEKVGLLREDLPHWEDFEYFVRIHKTVPYSIHPVPVYTVKYRAQANSTSRSKANIERMKHCYLSVLDDIFNDPNLPPEPKAMCSFAYARIFRVLARIQLTSGRPDIAREFALQALQHPRVGIKEWLSNLSTILLQSFFPVALYQVLANWNRSLKLGLASLRQQSYNQPLANG